MDIDKIKAQYENGQRDFRAVDLNHLILDHLILNGVDFRGANLEYASFRGAELQNADFRGSELDGTNFEGANLQYANFEGMNLYDAVFDYAELGYIDLKMLDTTYLNKHHEKLNYGQLSIFPSTNFQYAKLQFAKLNRAIISDPYVINFIQSKSNRLANRLGQYKFRLQLLNLYNYRCLITDSDIQILLEAAHIEPYEKNQNNDPSNGLLLCVDIHKLFDAHLIAIDENKKIHIHPSLEKSHYQQYDNTFLKLNKHNCNKPDASALKERYKEAMKHWKNLEKRQSMQVLTDERIFSL